MPEAATSPVPRDFLAIGPRLFTNDQLNFITHCVILYRYSGTPIRCDLYCLVKPIQAQKHARFFRQTMADRSQQVASNPFGLSGSIDGASGSLAHNQVHWSISIRISLFFTAFLQGPAPADRILRSAIGLCCLPARNRLKLDGILRLGSYPLPDIGWCILSMWKSPSLCTFSMPSNCLVAVSLTVLAPVGADDADGTGFSR